MRTFDWSDYRGKRTYFRHSVFWTLLVTLAVRTHVTIHLNVLII